MNGQTTKNEPVYANSVGSQAAHNTRYVVDPALLFSFQPPRIQKADAVALQANTATPP